MEDEIDSLLEEIYANDSYENDDFDLFDEIIIFKINENNHLQDEIFVA